MHLGGKYNHNIMMERNSLIIGIVSIKYLILRLHNVWYLCNFKRGQWIHIKIVKQNAGKL